MSIKDLEIPDSGLVVYLKEFGQVKVFKKMFKNEHRYYAQWCPNENELEQISRETFLLIHDQHWGIEQYQGFLKTSRQY